MAFSASDEHSDLTLIENRARSVAHLFVDRVAKTPEAEALSFPRGKDWESVTWAQTDARVRDLAAGLVALGILSEQRVAITSPSFTPTAPSCPMWSRSSRSLARPMGTGSSLLLT